MTLINRIDSLLEAATRIVWVSSDDPEEGQEDLIDAAWAIAKASPIRILSDKDLAAVAVEGGEAVGALFTGHTRDKFSFDVVVDSKHQSRGVGTLLTDAGVREFKSMAVDNPDLELDLDVVNPIMQGVLKKHGLVVLKDNGKNRVQMGFK